MLKKILIIGLISLNAYSIAEAQTCKEKNFGLPFRQVVMLNGYVVCDYGPDFDFEHSYEPQGKFRPTGGLWEGDSQPGLIFCRGGFNYCVFEPQN